MSSPAPRPEIESLPAPAQITSVPLVPESESAPEVPVTVQVALSEPLEASHYHQRVRIGHGEALAPQVLG